MTSRLVELAERVEKLAGPCRETDALIAAAFQIVPDFDPTQFIVPLIYDAQDDGSVKVYAGKMIDEAGHYVARRKASPYTASLDAAMTLVLEGCDFYFEVEQVMGGFCNYLYITVGGSVAPSHDLRGKGGKLHPTWKEAVAALPREIAGTSLRARAASEPSHGG